MGSPMEHHPLGQAARENDDLAEKFIGTASNGAAEAVRERGLELSDVMHLCEQRAIRTVMVMGGRAAELQEGVQRGLPMPFRFTTSELIAIEQMKVAYLDGILIGWHGRGIHEGGN